MLDIFGFCYRGLYTSTPVCFIFLLCSKALKNRTQAIVLLNPSISVILIQLNFLMLKSKVSAMPQFQSQTQIQPRKDTDFAHPPKAVACFYH